MFGQPVFQGSLRKPLRGYREKTKTHMRWLIEKEEKYSDKLMQQIATKKDLRRAENIVVSANVIIITKMIIGSYALYQANLI